MRTLLLSEESYDRRVFDECNRSHGHELGFLDVRLDARTAPALGAIADTTLANLDDIEAGRTCPNQL
jgi:hypothetical protein